MRTLDRNRPYGTCLPPDELAAYVQDGLLFDNRGKQVVRPGETPAAAKPPAAADPPDDKDAEIARLNAQLGARSDSPPAPSETDGDDADGLARDPSAPVSVPDGPWQGWDFPEQRAMAKKLGFKGARGGGTKDEVHAFLAGILGA